MMRIIELIFLLMTFACGEPCLPVPAHEARVAAVNWEGGDAPLLARAAAAWGMVAGSGGAVVRWGRLDGPLGLTTPSLGLVELDERADWEAYDLESVLDHELGHLQGLGHTQGGIMDPYLQRHDQRRLCLE